jgi:uncharacterized protein YndB with AHSA1/START domain
VIVTRARTVAAAPAAVWAVVGDPHRFPAWWPHTERVEGVDEDAWTLVLRTPKGKAVRVDHRLATSEPGRRRAWALVVAGTPFERFVRESTTEVSLAPDSGGTAVTVAGMRRLRGINRLGTPIVRRAMVRELDAAGASPAPAPRCRPAPGRCCATSSA